MNSGCAEIIRDIEEHFAADSRLRGAEIRVEVHEDRVLLYGTVRTYAARLAAREGASAVTGMQHLEDRLCIKNPPKFRSPSDEEITWSAELALAVNADLDSSTIRVVANGGAITLSGAVDAYWKKCRAQEIAYDIPGVVRVSNMLSVVPREIHPDPDIYRAVTDAFDRTGIDFAQVVVEVDNGAVSLSGSVPSRYDLFRILDAVRHTGGVIEISGNLRAADMDHRC